VWLLLSSDLCGSSVGSRRSPILLGVGSGEGSGNTAPDLDCAISGGAAARGEVDAASVAGGSSRIAAPAAAIG
jgi:hypothetical protein